MIKLSVWYYFRFFLRVLIYSINYKVEHENSNKIAMEINAREN